MRQATRRNRSGGLRRLQRELEYYRRVLRHPGTPRASRWLLAAAIAYALSPIDLIPDWLPLVGHLDDVIIVPALLYLAMRLVPDAVREECSQNPTE